MLSCTSVNGYQLLALFLISYLSICGPSLTEGVKISRDDNATYPEATIPQGKMRGINMVTRHNRTVFGFIGIPYAQPPVGDLRFRAPVPPDPWNGTLDATSDTEPCPQFNDARKIGGNEDCLHLNVFTPQLPESDNSTLLPVMVFVIGGKFRAGNNSIERFRPDNLLDEDVVLVVPNFRLGVLGFLTTGDEASPGNYGLKDIVRTLEWIQENIQHLGGDPNQVTLFGGSSGAAMVHLVVLSNLTNGIVHKYILQSGSALSHIAIHPKESCKKRAIQLADHFGCPTNSSTLLVNCLRGLDASRFVDTNSIFHKWGSYPSFIWNPSTEPDIDGALLTDIPAKLYAAGKFRDLPWIASVNGDEGPLLVNKFYEDPNLFEDFLRDIDFVLPYMMEYYAVVDDVEAYTSALKSFYLNDLSADRSILLANFSDLVSDAEFVYFVYTAVHQQQAIAQSPQYFCSFNYRGTFSSAHALAIDSNADPGAVHGDELIYLFGYQGERDGVTDLEYSEADYVMMDTMVQLWTSFAINGTPTTRDSISTTTWEPYSSLNNYLRIGNRSDTALEMEYNMFRERMQFWDELRLRLRPHRASLDSY